MHELYASEFPLESWTDAEREALTPFVTNLDSQVAALRNLPPELVGALCSRASRAPSYLVRLLYTDYLAPLLADPAIAGDVRELINFYRTGNLEKLAVKGRAFYAKWLAAYGDDSIAQMTGTHLVFWGISQIAMKVIQDQRIGLEPIEKSTRYVQYGNKVGGKYLYYTPKPDLERLGLLAEYRETMDHLFDTYRELQAPLIVWLRQNYEEKDSVLEKKAFDTLRGLLPVATLSQVAFRGNAQAFEYLINRTSRHPLGELRWIANAVKTELDKEIPSLLLRVNDPKSGEYQEYLAGRNKKIGDFAAQKKIDADEPEISGKPQVELVEWDPDAESKILTGILYPVLHKSWQTTRAIADKLSREEKKELLAAYLNGRTARWQKIGRAFENSYLRFDLTMNIGAYRDLHRHRMLTQQRQLFTTRHGFDLPREVNEAGLAPRYGAAQKKAHELFVKIEKHDRELAQYAVPMACRMRFQQFENLRQFSWQVELRTISQGHPDYRWIEQEKYRLVAAKYPLLAEAILVDLNDYPFARRGTEEKIAAKEAEIIRKLQEKSSP